METSRVIRDELAVREKAASVCTSLVMQERCQSQRCGASSFFTRNTGAEAPRSWLPCLSQGCGQALSLAAPMGGVECALTCLPRCRYSVRRSMPRTCAARALLPFKSFSARDM